MATLHNLLADAPRTIVRQLRSLFEDQSTAEVEIEERYQRDRKANETELGEALEKLESKLKKELHGAEQEHSLAIKRITAYFDADQKAVREAYKADRDALIEKARENKDATQKKLDEAIWLSESLYEARKDDPRDEYEQTLKVLESAMEEAEKIEEEAKRLLQRSRMKSVAAGERGAGQTVDQIQAFDPNAAVEEAMEQSRSLLAELRTRRLFKVFRGPLVLVLIVLGIGLATAAQGLRSQWAIDVWLIVAALVSTVVMVGFFGGLYILARSRAAATWADLMSALTSARLAHDRCVSHAAEKRDVKAAELLATRDREVREAKERYEPILKEIRRRRDRRLQRIDQKYPARLDELKAQREQALHEAHDEYAKQKAAANDAFERGSSEARDRAGTRRRTIQERYEQEWGDLESRWTGGMKRVYETRAALLEEDSKYFPAWSDERWNGWNPPHEFAPAIRFGTSHIDLNAFPGGLPKDERLHVDGPSQFDLPATLAFPDHCSLLIETNGEDGDAPTRILQTVMLRLLTCLPPGKVRFTILDPVGLGQNFAGFMHLADYNDAFVGGRIWTEARHIEQRLLDLTEHMENVIQKYLRNEFETIDQYNQQAGEIAEPYRFLVISDFPVNFTETAAKRLASILQSGARCGVYTLIVRDTRHKLVAGLDESDLRRSSLTLARRHEGMKAWRHEGDDGAVPNDASCLRASVPSCLFQWQDDDFRDLPLAADDPPSDEFITRVLHVVGRAALDSTRVEVPFDVIAPPSEKLWSLSSSDDLRVALGRSGATKLQYLTLGVGTAQHALIAGKTGSGKSTLLHALITNLALWYSPDEVELYLVDFKKGVEFKTYATHRLPHVRAVAVESDREFGISVLQRLDQELARRGERFRQVGVQDLKSFRKASPEEPMPRVLLIIDEFQEFFTEDDKIGQDAAMLLDRLVRQGRAFGMHVLLGSQTLGGAYSLARSTIGQMAVRIALQCSEADSYLILSDDNAAARLLSRPGEAIYNDAAGVIEGNSPFQVVWLPDERRERFLSQVQSKARDNGSLARRSYPEPIVFEGNVPADIARNSQLRESLESVEWSKAGGTGVSPVRAWFGEAISIKEPTHALFRRLSGHNLLMVGQRDDAALAILSASLVSLAAQISPSLSGRASGGGSSASTIGDDSPTPQPPPSREGEFARPTSGELATFYILDGSAAETNHSEYIDHLAASLPHQVKVARLRETPDVINEIANELARRQSDDRTDAPPIFLLIYGAQRFRMLRQEESFSFSMDDDGKPPSPDKLFGTILREGPPLGIHTLVWCDTVSNVGRTFDRQSQRDFEMRVLFQMSPADSSHLIDSPAAAKLGFHRAIFYSEEDGRIEKFRPYALPPRDWLDEVRETLQGRCASGPRL